MKKILVVCRDGRESYLSFALPALLDLGFSVDISIESPFTLRNLPPDIHNKIQVFSVYRNSALPKSTYLRLIVEWVKTKKLGDWANNYDIVLNVKTGSVYDPPLSSKAKTIYHLYDPMINHAYSYRIRYAHLMKLYYVLFDNIITNRCKKAVILANSYWTQRVLAARNVVSRVIYPPCKIDDLHGARHRCTQIISVGRISIEKRHEDTLKIARHLPDMEFIILGELQDLAYYRRLTRLKTSNVEIITPTHTEVRKLLCMYLAESQIYLHSCDEESFGVAIVEAMASGCVPVVRNVAGPREIVTCESGFKWDSIFEAVEYISTIISNDKLREEISSNAVARAKKFSPEVYQERLKEIIRTL